MKNLLSGGLVTKWRKLRIPQGLENVHELFPAVKRWAKLERPSGAGFAVISFHRIVRKPVLTQTLERWAKLGSPSGAGFVKLPL